MVEGDINSAPSFRKDRPSKNTVDGKRRRFLIKQVKLYMDFIPSVLSTGWLYDFLEERSQGRGGQNRIPLSDLHVKPRMMICKPVFSFPFLVHRWEKDSWEESNVVHLSFPFLDPSWVLDCIKGGSLICTLVPRSFKCCYSLIRQSLFSRSFCVFAFFTILRATGFMVWENCSTSG